jgi:hypothetical protein
MLFCAMHVLLSWDSFVSLNSRLMRKLELLMLNGLFIKQFLHLGTRANQIMEEHHGKG